MIVVLLRSVEVSADFRKGLTAYQRGDFATALRELEPLAEQGNASAQFLLSRIYAHGQGVPQDYKTAVKWLTLAAKQGVAGAQRNLGVMYAKGEGVPQDSFYAHMWANIAASNGDEKGAKLRDALAQEMTPSQLEKAQELARECVCKQYKGC